MSDVRCFTSLLPISMLRGTIINLVDPASRRILVSKIMPCMSEKSLHGNTANGSLQQFCLFDGTHYMDFFLIIIVLIHAYRPDL